MSVDTILLVEDDNSLREVMAFQLRSGARHVVAVHGGAQAIKHLQEHPCPDVIITDIKMPQVDGFEVMRFARQHCPGVPVLVVTAFGSVEMAVTAMRAGAFDFVSKPFHKEQFLLTVEKACAQRRLLKENQQLRENPRARDEDDEVVAVSPVMQEVLQQARQVAATQATVMLLGESGSGKEVLAREIHRASDRKHKPLVAINCAAIPRELLESELFGFAKGAFTGAHKERIGKFQAADGGTLFLDEIGDLDDALQSKLLRVLEQRTVDVLGGPTVEVNVRIVTATHRPMEADVSAGRFRRDLFFRLAVVPIWIPPLRDRPEDAQVLFKRFVTRFAGGAAVTLSEDLVAAISKRRWPGNVRELRNVAERMVALRRSPHLTLADLPAEPALGGDEAHPVLRLDPKHIELPTGGASLEDIERAVVTYALEHSAWNIAAAARFLRTPRHILVYRMEKFGIKKVTD